MKFNEKLVVINEIQSHMIS